MGYDVGVMSNRENKIAGRKALNGDGRARRLRKDARRRANKAARRAAKDFS